MTTQLVISRVAIYLLSIVMIIFGIYHFMEPHAMLVFVPTNIYSLALLLIIFVLTIHLPNYNHAGDVEMRQNALINMLKDTALAAFALHIAGSADIHGVKY
jgi:hypothetical protein